jgi:RNA polymerase sigma-70 factor (ECF subfamily)
MGELSIKQIVERCQRGDQQAFGLLYTVMHDRLRRVCRHYVADEATADDLLHDAFVLIFSKIDTVNDPAKAEAWMARVVHNLGRTWQHRQREAPVVSLDDLERPLSAAAAVPAAVSYDEILRLVDALPQSYRRVFRLSVLDGMSHQEIAALLGIEPHTSSAQLSRAKLLLRRWLRPMVLLLVAALLPLKTTKTPPLEGRGINAAGEHAKPVIAAAETVSTGDTATAVVAATAAVSTAAVAATDAVNTTAVVAADTAAATIAAVVAAAETVAPDTAASTVSPSVPDVGCRVAVSHASPSEWTIALAYSGTGSSDDTQLPYADPDMNPSVYDSVANHRLPLTVGLTVSRRLGQHWQVGLGLQYTRLASSLASGNSYAQLQQEQRVRYLGLPLQAGWRRELLPRLSLHAAANVTLQLPLRSTLESRFVLNGHTVSRSEERLRPGWQWSAGVGLGLEYNVTPAVGFFVEPSLQHYFRNGSGVETWQTEHPFVVTVPLGIRITIK